MSSELVKVPFHEGEILAVKDDRGEWVVVKPLCDGIGMDTSGQVQRMKRQTWAEGWTCIMPVQLPGDGQTREVFCLHRKRIAMWLATLDVKRVKEEVRPHLARLQKEAADVLDAYFTKKAAPAPEPPRTSAGSLVENVRLLLTAVEALAEQDRRIGTVETKLAEIEAARAEASVEMTTAERAEGKPADVTTRMKVVRLHRAYCVAKGANYQETWRWLYREFRDRYHFDAQTRAANRKGVSALDIIEQEGLMDALYVLASDLLIAPKATEARP